MIKLPMQLLMNTVCRVSNPTCLLLPALRTFPAWYVAPSLLPVSNIIETNVFSPNQNPSLAMAIAVYPLSLNLSVIAKPWLSLLVYLANPQYQPSLASNSQPPLMHFNPQLLTDYILEQLVLLTDMHLPTLPKMILTHVVLINPN